MKHEINIITLLKTRTLIDDFFIWAGKVALVITILFAFNSLTSFNIANGQVESDIRTKKEEEEKEETERSTKERKRRAVTKISDNLYVRIFCHDDKIDTMDAREYGYYMSN